MRIEIYENKKGEVSSIRLLEKHIVKDEYVIFYGTRSRSYGMSKEDAFRICKKFFVGKLNISQRIELNIDISRGILTVEEFVNSKLSHDVF